MAGKVWVIGGSGASSRSGRASSRASSSDSVPAPGERSADPPRPPEPARRSDLLVAYLLGPVSSALWLRGRRRFVWNGIGVLSAAVLLVLLLRGDLAGGLLLSTRFGALPWLIVVPAMILALFTVWARAIAAAGRRAPSFPGWLRSPAVVGALGFLVPGLGHQILGRYRRAARAFWLLGPLVASAAVLAGWRELWFRNLAARSPALSGPALEAVLAAAGVTALLAAAVWISEAVDGARRATPSRIRTGADATGTALFAAIVLFLVAFRPAPTAYCLDSTAERMTVAGFRLIPLAMAEAAARLDPAEPRYLARALELDEALGRHEAAIEKRRILEARTREHLEVVWAEGHGLSAARGKPVPASREPSRATSVETAMR